MAFTITVRIDDETLRRIKKLAKHAGLYYRQQGEDRLNLTAWARAALTREVERQERELQEADHGEDTPESSD